MGNSKESLPVILGGDAPAAATPSPNRHAGHAIAKTANEATALAAAAAFSSAPFSLLLLRRWLTGRAASAASLLAARPAAVVWPETTKVHVLIPASQPMRPPPRLLFAEKGWRRRLTGFPFRCRPRENTPPSKCSLKTRDAFENSDEAASQQATGGSLRQFRRAGRPATDGRATQSRRRRQDLKMADLTFGPGGTPAGLLDGSVPLDGSTAAAGVKAQSPPASDPDVVPEQTRSRA
eukprot:scaffold24836_cov57-Phaeocystis_antarctica.AAC.2